MCCALGVITYAGLPRFCAWAMIDAQTCSEEQLSIKAWPTPIRATSDPRSEVRGEVDAANQCVMTFMSLLSRMPRASPILWLHVVRPHRFRNTATRAEEKGVRVCADSSEDLQWTIGSSVDASTSTATW